MSPHQLSPQHSPMGRISPAKQTTLSFQESTAMIQQPKQQQSVQQNSTEYQQQSTTIQPSNLQQHVQPQNQQYAQQHNQQHPIQQHTQQHPIQQHTQHSPAQQTMHQASHTSQHQFAHTPQHQEDIEELVHMLDKSDISLPSVEHHTLPFPHQSTPSPTKQVHFSSTKAEQSETIPQYASVNKKASTLPTSSTLPAPSNKTTFIDPMYATIEETSKGILPILHLSIFT